MLEEFIFTFLKLNDIIFLDKAYGNN